ncbi:hypothetical protein KA005_51860 [bacterium]|nr:hypothetical protein [bacterium]
MWQDWLNGMFEFLGGLFITLSCIKLHRDKKVRGVSFIHVAYFTAWGYWNIHYYPHLGQWISFAGGLSVVLVNTIWLGMLIYYTRRERNDKNHIS